MPTWTWGALALAALARLCLAMGTDVYSDTAYYWHWSQQLDASYFDHPAGIAVFLRLFGIPGGQLVASVATVIVPAVLAGVVAGRDAAWRAAALGAVLPFGLIVSVMLGPDTGAALAGGASAALAWRGKVVAAGLALAVAVFFKLPAVLFAPGLLLIGWQRGARGGLAAAALVASFGLLPTCWWNLTHDWQNVRFQFHHGVTAGRGGVWKALELVVAQLGLIGPVAFPIAVAAVRERRLLGLWVAAFLPVGFFMVAALFARPEANWPALGAVVMVALVAASARGRVFSAVVVASGLVSAAAVVFLTVPMPWTVVSDPLRRLHGWQALAPLRVDPAPVLIASNYDVAGPLAHLTGKPVGVVSARPSQYDVWGLPEAADGADEVVWVSRWDEPPPASLEARWPEVSRAPDLVGFFGPRETQRFAVFRLRGRSERGPTR